MQTRPMQTIPTRPIGFTGTVLLGAPTTDGTWHVARVTIGRDDFRADSADRAEARGTTHRSRDLVDVWSSAPGQGHSVIPVALLEGTGLYLCEPVTAVAEAEAAIAQIRLNLESAWHPDDLAAWTKDLREAQRDLAQAVEAKRICDALVGVAS